MEAEAEARRYRGRGTEEKEMKDSIVLEKDQKKEKELEIKYMSHQVEILKKELEAAKEREKWHLQVEQQSHAR